MKIHDREIGIAHPAYIVAEIGINHNGDTSLARQMISAAKECGCDAVKFQNYKTEKFIEQRSEYWEYRQGMRIVREKQHDMFKRCEVNKGQLQWLKNHADHVGIHMHSTPMCVEGVQECVDLGFGVIKNGSDCLQDLELIDYMRNTNLPVVLSTGMCERDDIDRAVDRFVEFRKTDNLILLHCTSAYPCRDEDVNMRRMTVLRRRYGLPVGFSDHSRGHTAAVLAVAHRAIWIEKHFTIDKNLPGPDHAFSADPSEMRLLVRMVRRAEAQLGTASLGMTETERENRKAWFK